ncbi:(2Fe-2S)-binding protein [Catellatospora chokoriensis]|uniref:(2Fe-2S)-binding protein n=1 Tax=Catellatospora chokoriensis TaxID=310353 RepID=A0A8J3JMP2_9ACTN|nr:2Fe-2S iron-sulfur cluster-binding protein [Catellatospora chokoriensis]GIF87786.1 (2Fe-2S)-binding protein [Catellatospora chokoriensis]
MQLLINGRHHEIEHGDEPLVWVLRDELGLTGTHYGCGIGMCGCCTVLLAGRPARSCQITAAEVGERPVVTLEGLAERDADGAVVALHPVQQAFLENPLQCGWCLPGHVLSAVALLARDPAPDAAAIAEAAQPNLCRCGGYNTIKAAVARAAELARDA